MSYHKMTTISGFRAGWKPNSGMDFESHYVGTCRSGHWGAQTALKLGRRLGIAGPVSVTYSTGDLSGKGRGGYDSALTVDESGVTKRPLSASETEYSDADDVNAIYDETASHA